MVLLLLSSLLIGGCSKLLPTLPNELALNYSAVRPKPTLTDFNSSMVCMDNLMLLSKSQPIYLTSQGLFNYTAEHSISRGGKEMLISTVSQMANRSKAIRFVAYGADIKDMLDLQGAHPNKRSFRAPDYFIRGGVTQHNKKLWTSQSGAGFSGEFEIDDHQYEPLTSFSEQNGFGTISIDLNVGTISNLQMVPGMTSSNTIAMYTGDSKSVTADLSVGQFGLTFSLNDNIKRDFNAVYRTLIQVGMIELVGRLQKIPYWRCLENAGSIPERSKQLRKQFDEMAKIPSTLVRFVQQRLIAMEYYNKQADGRFDEATKQAIESYQQHHNLIATGEIDFEMFKMMNLYDPVGGIRQVGLVPDSKKSFGAKVPYSPGLSVHAPET